MRNRLLVTGGAGVIGANCVLARIAAGDQVVNLDKLTYAGNVESLLSVKRLRAIPSFRAASRIVS
jgi:dTDP-glucose 4,6-dehydratase